MDANDTRLPTPGAFTGEFQKIMEGAKDWKEVQDRLKGKTITYFDFETTGISDYDGQDITNDSVQLGAVQVKDGKIVKRFNVYTNPESKLSDWSAKNLGRDVLDENGNRILDENGKPTTTPVTPEWLAQQKSKNDAIKEFIEFIGPDALLGGQNVPFDIEILKRMAADAGVELNIAGTIDSKDLASLLPKYDPEKGIDGPKAPDRKTGEIKATSSLGPVANFLGFEPANWHSADGDAEDSYNLVSKLIDRAAKEDNQDLSLLDFPAMKKRYEERMAEFKDVVSPDSPITQNQENALDRFTASSNLNIVAIANKALKTAKTRGEAAEILKTLHMLENQKAPEASEPELESLFGYRKNLYKTINKHLRKPESDRKNSPKLNANIADIDNLIEKQTPTTEPVTVFRGLSGPAAERLRAAAVGDVFTEPGFSSTSGDAQTMWGFAYGTGEVGAELHLTLPPGSKFIDVDDYIPKQMGPMEVARESEALLPRGIKFRIDNVSDNVITATVLPESDNVLPDVFEKEGPELNSTESDSDFSPEPSSQEALEEAYKELRAANRVQMMEPKATADKKLNDDDYVVMDLLRDTIRNGSVIDIEDIKDEAENAGVSSSLSKTIASLKKKGILTAAPDDKNRLALTESGLEKVAIVQAGMDKERRDAEERDAARIAEAKANIAAREAAKTPEQREQEKLQQAQQDARNAARAQRAEASRLFRETNLNSSDNNAIQLIDDDMFDDPSELREGSTLDKSMFEDSLRDMYEGEDLPEGETVSSLVSKTIDSLQKKGILTTTPGDKSRLALTEQGAEKLRERLGLPPNSKAALEISEKEEPGAPQYNSDESDSDFDDVEVEFDVPSRNASAPATYSVINEVIGDLAEKYGPTIGTSPEFDIGNITVLDSFSRQVIEAADNYKQTQDAGDKKLYMDKLLKMLDYRSGLIHLANLHSLSSRNSIADSKLSGDPLLTNGELSLINSKITPRNILGSEINPAGTTLTAKKQEFRRKALVMTMTELRADLAARDAKAPKITGLPSNWETYSLVKALDDAIEQSTKAAARHYNMITLEGSQLAGLKQGIGKSMLWRESAALSFKDSTGEYPGILRVAEGISGGLAATPKEIRAIIASVSDFGDKINMNAGSSHHYDMFITPDAGPLDHPARRDLVAKGILKPTKPTTLAYSSHLTGTVFFMVRLRRNQDDYDSGRLVNKGDATSPYSVEIRPNSTDALDSTVHHEFGHAAADSANLRPSDAVSGRPAPSLYGGSNDSEKFAEYMAKYIRTGQAPPWFIDVLRSKGLLKSQQN